MLNQQLQSEKVAPVRHGPQAFVSDCLNTDMQSDKANRNVLTCIIAIIIMIPLGSVHTVRAEGARIHDSSTSLYLPGLHGFSSN